MDEHAAADQGVVGFEREMSSLSLRLPVIVYVPHSYWMFGSGHLV